MLVKQIDKKTALGLAAKGKEVRMEPEELRKAGQWIPVEKGGIE